MYCPRCGEANQEADRFCSSCGQDLTTYQRLWSASRAPGQTPPAAWPPQASNAQAHPAPQHRLPMPAGTIPRIPSYLGWAVAVLVCCWPAWPAGIVAVVYASRTESWLAEGRLAEAKECSRLAKIWCWVTFGAGLVLWAVALTIVIWFSYQLATRQAGAGGLFV